jgi:hypothetical protein
VRALLDLWDEPALAPHPALVAAKTPSPREVAQAASVLGWLSEDRLFPVAVIDRGEE